MHPKMKPIHASSSQELLDLLRRQGIKVPSRGKGRKKEHVEIYTACHLISTLAAAGLLGFPLTLTHDDKPDFLLQLEGQCIGLEVTECVDENDAKHDAWLNEHKPEEYIESGRFRYGQTYSREYLRNMRSGNVPPSPGYSGDEVECEWASYMADLIEKKRSKIKNFNCLNFDKKWLLIYDNLFLPMPDMDICIKYLRPRIQQTWCADPAFDAIFIEDEASIIRISETDHEVMSINSL